MEKGDYKIEEYGEPTPLSISDLERKSFVLTLLKNIRVLSTKEETNETRKEDK